MGHIGAGLLTALLLLLTTTESSSGELVVCAERPGSGSWIYRVVDERRCWFQARGLRRGREKPREELRWPAPEPLPALEVSEPTRPPWQLEERFRGETR